MNKKVFMYIYFLTVISKSQNHTYCTKQERRKYKIT